MEWRRIAIDVDTSGNVLGAHVQFHDDDGFYESVVMIVAPFDTLSEVLAGALRELPVRGMQLGLDLES